MSYPSRKSTPPTNPDESGVRPLHRTDKAVLEDLTELAQLMPPPPPAASSETVRALDELRSLALGR